MIRIVVLVLLAINLLYLGWSYRIAGTHARLTAVAPSTAASKPAPPVAPPAPPPCATVGPFTDEAQALAVSAQLAAAGWGVLRRDSSETLHEGWWVHLSNADEKQQGRAVNALHRAGIREAFAIPDDPQFRVSVGVFPEEGLAEDRAAQVQRLKLDAVVTERVRDQTVTWFDVPGVARETLSDGRLATAGVAMENLRVEDCPPAAPVAPAEPAAAIIPAP